MPLSLVYIFMKSMKSMKSMKTMKSMMSSSWGLHGVFMACFYTKVFY